MICISHEVYEYFLNGLTDTFNHIDEVNLPFKILNNDNN